MGLPQLPDKQAYFDYLQNRSVAGFLYRQYWLYPRLSRKLSGKVLDYGCGIGDFLRFRANTVGTDINEHNVAYCRQRGTIALHVDNNHIPVEDGCFDGVMFDNVLEHILSDRVDAVITEIKRVLKPGGTIVVGLPGSKGFASDPDHKVFYSEASLVSLMATHGFEMRESFGMPLDIRKLEGVLRQFCIYSVFTLKA